MFRIPWAHLLLRNSVPLPAIIISSTLYVSLLILSIKVLLEIIIIFRQVCLLCLYIVMCVHSFQLSILNLISFTLLASNAFDFPFSFWVSYFVLLVSIEYVGVYSFPHCFKVIVVLFLLFFVLFLLLVFYFKFKW